MTTRCNMTHCAWWEPEGLQIVKVDPVAWKLGQPDLLVSLRATARKGLGVFAKEDAG